MVDVAALEGRADGGAEDAVFVGFRCRVEAWMEVFRCLFDG